MLTVNNMKLNTSQNEDKNEKMEICSIEEMLKKEMF